MYGRHYKKDEPINSAVAWLRQNSPQGAKAFPGIKSLPRIQTFPRIDFPDCEMITSNNVSHTYWGLSKLTKRSLPPPLLVLEFKVARQRRQREHQNNRFTKQNFHSAHRVGRNVMTFEGTRIRFLGDALATITVMGSYGKLLFNFQKFWLREGGTRPTLPFSLLRACFKESRVAGTVVSVHLRAFARARYFFHLPAICKVIEYFKVFLKKRPQSKYDLKCHRGNVIWISLRLTWRIEGFTSQRGWGRPLPSFNFRVLKFMYRFLYATNSWIFTF